MPYGGDKKEARAIKKKGLDMYAEREQHEQISEAQRGAVGGVGGGARGRRRHACRVVKGV